MTLDTLLGSLTPATLDDGTPISAGQARRLACEAGIIPAVLGGDGDPPVPAHDERAHDDS